MSPLVEGWKHFYGCRGSMSPLGCYYISMGTSRFSKAWTIKHFVTLIGYNEISSLVEQLELCLYKQLYHLHFMLMGRRQLSELNTSLPEDNAVGTPVDAVAGQGNATVEGHDVGGSIGGGSGHGSTNVDVGHGGVDVNTNHKGKPVTVRVYPGLNPFQYGYASQAADELLLDPVATFFFRQEDLHQGAKMWLRFTKPPPQRLGFLPRRVAHTIPFSSASSFSILRRFSIDPRSAEAIAVVETLKTCELPAAKGEEKLCATSMEDMVDFVRTKLGTDHVHVLATTTSQKDHGGDDRTRQYIVESEVKVTMVSAGDKLTSVTCHRQPYVYAVYYCHETYRTKLYEVDLVGDEEGRKVKAVAVCHEDTSAWNPMHVAFMVLHEKPGYGTVCHFLPQDHLVWVPSTSHK